MSIKTLARSVVVFTACAWASANAQAPFTIEGPIDAIDPVNRIITVMGVPVEIPAAMPLDLTNNGGVPVTGATLQALLDDAAPNRVRSILKSGTTDPSSYWGAVFRMRVGTQSPLAGGGFKYVASAPVSLALAEHTLVGISQSVDTVNNTWTINGVTCAVSPDARFKASIRDLGGQPIPVSGLVGVIGQPVSVVGYRYNNTLYAEQVDTAVVLPSNNPNSDAVRVLFAKAVFNVKTASYAISIKGSVNPYDAGTIITISDISNPLKPVTLGTTPLKVGAVAGLGDFVVTVNSKTLPTNLRFVSNHGGTTTFVPTAK